MRDKINADDLDFTTPRGRLVGNFVIALAQALDHWPTAAEYLAAARVPTASVHHLYEWDDTIAAEAHRLNQVYGHLRQVKIRIEIAGSVEAVRAVFPVYRVDSSNQKGYMALTEILRCPTATQTMTEELERQLRLLVERNRRLMAVAEIAIVLRLFDLALGLLHAYNEAQKPKAA